MADRCQLIVLGLAVALAVLAPTAALATPPDTFRIPVEGTFIDEGASAACGFDVLFEMSGIQTIQVLYDAAGNPIRVQVHKNIEGTVSANGITLREIEHGQVFYDLVEGTETDIGLVFACSCPAAEPPSPTWADSSSTPKATSPSRPVPTRHSTATSPPSAPLSAELGSAGRTRRTSRLPAAVPLACHIGGSITVPSGQSRSLPSDR